MRAPGRRSVFDVVLMSEGEGFAFAVTLGGAHAVHMPLLGLGFQLIMVLGTGGA
jgi:hypothetical protein